jgi:peptidoglycan hydrolase-like protein with peptidoglycan-binding domain
MRRALSQHLVLVEKRAAARLTKRRTQMKKILSIFLSLLFVAAVVTAAQNTNKSTTAQNANATAKPPRKPPFRASKDQIKQAQAILKTRSFYVGEETGKLDDDTRAGLKKYQAAEGLKATGTLNKVTLEKMAITLTDKQRAM